MNANFVATDLESAVEELANLKEFLANGIERIHRVSLPEPGERYSTQLLGAARQEAAAFLNRLACRLDVAPVQFV